MSHDLDSHLAWRPPPPYVSIIGDTQHVHRILMGMLAMTDGCSGCANQVADNIAEDPQQMLTLHDVMRGLAQSRDEVVMDPAPAGTDVQLALLPVDTRRQMVLEGLSWMGRQTRSVNSWWEVWLHPKTLCAWTGAPAPPTLHVMNNRFRARRGERSMMRGGMWDAVQRREPGLAPVEGTLPGSTARRSPDPARAS